MSGLVPALLVLAFGALQASAAPDRAPAIYHDIDGGTIDLAAPVGGATVIFFVSTTCPISNRYRPEILRLCRRASEGGVRCALVYTDSAISDAEVLRHRATFGPTPPAAIVDHGRLLVGRMGASVTPEAAIVGAGVLLHYRGRIDNRFEDIGRERRVVTERDLSAALEDVLAGRPVAVPRTTPVGCFIE